jgi:N6-adenosine-specific RNA methylase IME4
MDPPWHVGLKLKYPVLKDKDILAIQFEVLQTTGYLMIWILDMKAKEFIKKVEDRGYTHKATVTWAKLTKNNKPVNGWGVTVRHSTEKLYIFAKGNVKEISNLRKMNDLILAQVRGESVKPDEIY